MNKATKSRKMKLIQIFSTVAAISISFGAATVASAEYNPATGEDDMIFISEVQEVSMGNSLAKNVEEKFGLDPDTDMQRRVGDIGQRLSSVCERPNLTYSFSVLEGKDLDEEQRYNAFALPGGYVYIFKDMVTDVKSDDELAAILAHEIGHIVAKHGVKKLQSSIGMAALNLLGAVTKADRRTRAKSSAAIAQLMMAYSRQAEFEADKLSVVYLEKAGFDPKAASAFIDRLLKKQLKGKIHQFHYLRSHPYISERKAFLNKEIEGGLTFNDYINTTDESKRAGW